MGRRKLRLSGCGCGYALLMLICLEMQSLLAFGMSFRNADCKNLNEDPNSDCLCSTVLTDFEIECPRFAEYAKFRMYLRTGNFMQMQCNITDSVEYKQLPNLQLGVNPRVQIQQCPLPGHTPIASIFDQLGVKKAHSLIFETNHLGANISRAHFNRLKNLTRLRFSSTELSHIPADLLNDLTNLTWLDMRISAEELPSELLTNLVNLDTLEITNSQLTTLPSGFLRNQHKLSHLSLWNNRFRNISKSLFDGANSLYDLDLSSNQLEQLPADVFAELKNMSHIHLSHNRFYELPEGLFAHNRNLTQIRFVNNDGKLRKLPQRFLANLPMLRVVRLSCQLRNLSEELFANSTNITNITLSSNGLTNLPDALFADQIELLSLDLSANKLKDLPNEIFQNNFKLVELNLERNALTKISRDIFESLRNLEKLILRNNRLVTVHSGSFAHLMNLRYLDMSDNRIDFNENNYSMSLTSPFANLEKLKILKLRKNALKYIYEDWKYSLAYLEQLDLSYNNLSYLNFSDLQYSNRAQLRVDLQHNQIKNIDFRYIDWLYEVTTYKSSDQLRPMVHVDLQYNPLNCDCKLLHFVQFLKNRNITATESAIKIIYDELICNEPANLAARKVIQLDDRELLCALHDTLKDKEDPKGYCASACVCMVRTADMALLVNCSNNQLTELPRLPDLPKQLKTMELYLQNNRIQELPDACTPGYANVTQLHLSGNNLTRLSAAQLPRNLTYLDLRYNQLRELNAESLKFLMSSLRADNSLKLAYNPWRCDCETKPLLLFMQNHYRSIGDRQNIYCLNNELVDHLPTSKMEDLSISDICPEDKRALIAIAILALIGLFIFALAALYYKYQLEIKIWCYAHNMFMWFVTEADLDKDKKYDAFISYSHKDEQFVFDHLLPQLEHGPIPYKLCVHERDFIVGGYIPDQILKSVEESRRTIVILSPNFIASEWARMEFSAAHKSSLTEGRARVICIMYSDIGDIEQLDADVKAYLKMNTYLKWGDPWFWDKLRYALPHRSGKASDKTAPNDACLVKIETKKFQDDRLELIKPSAIMAAQTTPPATNTKNPLIAQLNGVTTTKTTTTTTTTNPNPNSNQPNGNTNNTLPVYYMVNGKPTNGHANANGRDVGGGHINGAFTINTNSKQSDV